MRSYKGRGVVLHTIKYGETSMIAYLLTDVGGRCNFMVKGVGSSKRRSAKAGLFQPMFPLVFEGVESPRSQLHHFKEVERGILLSTTPFDVRKSTISLFMAEVIYRLVNESEANDTLFNFIWNSIEALDQIDEGVSNFHLWFLSNLSSFLGFYPGNEYVENNFFDIKEGTYTPTEPSHRICMSRDNARFFNDFIECNVMYLSEIGLNRGQRVDFLNSLIFYYSYHLDSVHTIKSIDILKEVF